MSKHAAEPGDGGEIVSAAGAARRSAAPKHGRARERVSRRAILHGPAESDPTPEDPVREQHAPDENDARLRADRPPHWG